MSFTVDNGSEWAEAVTDAFVGLGIESEGELQDLAHDIEDRMKATAPVGEHGGRHGRTSIDTKKGRDAEGFFVDVGPTLKGFYLGFYEFGTRHQPPRPFMRPAIEQAVSEWGR